MSRLTIAIEERDLSDLPLCQPLITNMADYSMPPPLRQRVMRGRLRLYRRFLFQSIFFARILIALQIKQNIINKRQRYQKQ